ncbi:MAG: Hpt domain-containing protein [Desulfosporosinus sp.]|nr:Hpt domain-containing protein [Desulfosporosinus sp.]
MDSNCRYDLQGFSDDLGLSIEEVANLFSDLIIEIKSEIYKMKIYLNEKDLEELRRVNHNIKGISANYRILDIYKETHTISDALKIGDFQALKILYQDFFIVSENAIQEITCYFERKGLVLNKL